ncbi:MAG: site-specific DNA-methyltransferase [Schleiferilactobacillus harbinensis]|jgi:site-specific DNA-methyltransferase (adenine-specific)|nr:site-specific DNA-methyltransferase [Schleiferilactobacillus harbinensis]MCI1912887.1 site-specific DNA-methyltransferase [Schleiferilactobacillus harbinensis]
MYDLLGIRNKDDLSAVSKALSIPVSKLRSYAQNVEIPTGDDAKKIQRFAHISELEYQLKMGDFTPEIEQGIFQNAHLISKIIAGNIASEKHKTTKQKPVFETKLGKLYHGDSLILMKEMESESVDLLFADPPFNLGKKYESKIDDRLSTQTYLDWTNEWVNECIRILKPGGSIFIWSLPKWNTYISEILNRHLTFRHWIAVNMKYGLPIKNKLYPAHYALLYYIKGEKPTTFNPERIPMAVCNTCGHELKDYGGYKHKMNPDGITLSDVWDDIYPVRHPKYKNRRSNELPVKLIDRIICLSTNPGDVVFDPFGGSGTTYAVAELLKRQWIGSEIGPTTQIIGRLKSFSGDKKQITKIHSEKNHLFLPRIEKLRRKNGFWLPEDYGS